MAVTFERQNGHNFRKKLADLFNDARQWLNGGSPLTGTQGAGKVIGDDGADGIGWVTPAAGSEAAIELTVATGGLAARDFVGVNASGQAIKADASDSAKGAIGYVTSAYSAAATASIYRKGLLTGLSGLTIGTQYYLSSTTPGGLTDTPTFADGDLVQYLGTAYSSTALEVNIGPAREVGL